MDWAKIVIQLREYYGWTQTKLAEKTGVNPAMISQIESGKRVPSVELRVKIRECVPDENMRRYWFKDLSDNPVAPSPPPPKTDGEVRQLEKRIEDLKEYIKDLKEQIQGYKDREQHLLGLIAAEKKTSENGSISHNTVHTGYRQKQMVSKL